MLSILQQKRQRGLWSLHSLTGGQLANWHEDLKVPSLFSSPGNLVNKNVIAIRTEHASYQMECFFFSIDSCSCNFVLIFSTTVCTDDPLELEREFLANLSNQPPPTKKKTSRKQVMTKTLPDPSATSQPSTTKKKAPRKQVRVLVICCFLFRCQGQCSL